MWSRTGNQCEIGHAKSGCSRGRSVRHRWPTQRYSAAAARNINAGRCSRKQDHAAPTAAARAVPVAIAVNLRVPGVATPSAVRLQGQITLATPTRKN